MTPPSYFFLFFLYFSFFSPVTCAPLSQSFFLSLAVSVLASLILSWDKVDVTVACRCCAVCSLIVDKIPVPGWSSSPTLLPCCPHLCVQRLQSVYLAVWSCSLCSFDVILPQLHHSDLYLTTSVETLVQIWMTQNNYFILNCNEHTPCFLHPSAISIPAERSASEAESVSLTKHFQESP